MTICDYTWHPPTEQTMNAIVELARRMVPDFDRKVAQAEAEIKACKRRNGASSARSVKRS